MSQLKNSPVFTGEQEDRKDFSTPNYGAGNNYSQAICTTLNGDLPKLLEAKVSSLTFSLCYENSEVAWDKIYQLLSLLRQAYQEVSHEV